MNIVVINRVDTVVLRFRYLIKVPKLITYMFKYFYQNYIMCERDDIEPPCKKMFIDKFECLNVKFVNIMLILPKFRGLHKKSKNFNKLYHINFPYVCRTRISFIVLRLKLKILQNFFAK